MTSDNLLNEIAAILANNPDQKFIKKFLKQILTNNEIKEIAQRWKIVTMLHSHVPQRAIANKLHTSLCKITRGSKELKKKDGVFTRILMKKKR